MNIQPSEEKITSAPMFADSGNQATRVIYDYPPSGVKGAWTVICSEVPFTTSNWHVAMNSFSSETILFDLGIVQDNGSVSAIISDMIISGAGLLLGPTPLHIPMMFPAGAKLVARGSCTSPHSTTGDVTCGLFFSETFFDGGPYRCAKTYGTIVASGRGTVIDPGGTVETWGAWTTVATATEAPMHHALISITNGNNLVRTSATYNVEIGVGAVGAEVAILQSMFFQFSAVDDQPKPALISLPLMAPAGSRLSARGRCSINDAADRLFDIGIVGLY